MNDRVLSLCEVDWKVKMEIDNIKAGADEKLLEKKLNQCMKENLEKNILIQKLIDELTHLKEISLFLFDNVSVDIQDRLDREGQIAEFKTLKRKKGEVRHSLQPKTRDLKNFTIKNGDRVTLDTPIYPPYTLKTRFTNKRSANDSFEFGRWSPPMPLTVGPIAIFLPDSDFVRVFFGSSKKSEHYDFPDPGDWIDLTVVVKDNGGLVTVGKSGSIIFDKVANCHVKYVTIGCGFLERGWTGQIANLAICRGEWHAEDEVPEDQVLFRFNGSKVIDR